MQQHYDCVSGTDLIIFLTIHCFICFFKRKKKKRKFHIRFTAFNTDASASGGTGYVPITAPSSVPSKGEPRFSTFTNAMSQLNIKDD